MEKIGMTYGEYCEILKNEIKRLNLKIKDLNSKNNTFSKCCKLEKDVVTLGFERMQELLNSKTGKEKFIGMLKYFFGYDFFEDMTEEQRQEYAKKGLFTKDNIDEIFGKVYGTHYEQEFKRPNSWEDMVLFLNRVFKVHNNDSINSNAKEPYDRILFAFNIMLENYYANSIAECRETNFILNIYNEFLNAFNDKRKVKIDSKTYPLITKALNKDERKFITIEDSKEKKIGFGDTFIMFCELYNNELEKVKAAYSESKKEQKIKAQIDKYFKRITSIPFDELENKYFPKYTNENYVEIINGVIEKLKEAVKNDESLIFHNSVTLMHYACYFKTKYYDSEKVFGKKEVSKGVK